MFFVADQPLLKKKTIERLLLTFHANPNHIIVPCIEDTYRNPVIFPNHLKNELGRLTGDEGGKCVLHNNPEKIITVECENIQEFCDIDTPESYRKLLRRC